MLRKSFHGWRVKPEIQNLTAIPTPSPRLDPVRPPTRPTPLTSLSPLSALFSYCQKNLPPTSHFRFTRQTTGFPLSIGSVAAGFSAAAYYPRAPEADPNSPGSFTKVEDPSPNVDSLRDSSVGVDDGREDDGEGLDRRRTLPEELSSTVVVLTCMSKDGTCEVFLLGQGPYLRFWLLDVDMFESLMWKSKAIVNKLEVCRGHEVRVALEEALKYRDKVANKLKGYPGREYGAAEDDYCSAEDDSDYCAAEDSLSPPNVLLPRSLQERTKFLVSDFYAVDDEDNKTIERFDQEMSKESPTLMKTMVHERD